MSSDSDLSSTATSSARSGRTATSSGPPRQRRRRSSSIPAATPTELAARARADGRELRRDPDHAQALGPPRRRRRSRRRHRRARLHGRRRARAAREPARPRARRACDARGYTADAFLRATRRSSSPASRSRRSTSRATRRATSPTTPTAASSPATCSSPARSAAPICRAATGRRCSSRSARSTERYPPETIVYSGPRPADDARRGARPQPVPGRSCAPRETFEAPRGTHDILPAEQPLWRRVTSEAERLCALYGYRPIQTPVFEDTGALRRAPRARARTSCRRRCTRSRIAAAAR